MQCTLCSSISQPFCADKKCQYFRCTECDLIFADPDTLLSQAEEKLIYDYHENGPNDLGYRAFLNHLTTPLLEKLSPGMKGLDFGSGPGPTLNLMLEKQGMKMSVYDIYYAPDTGQLSCQYDFVTCTEVAEHFREPDKSWAQLIGLIKPGGWLGVMTCMFTKETADDFNLWSYKGDPTHISFYTPETIQWIARHFRLELEIVNDRVILFRKNKVAL
ncbi:class I SAM-dependent methyltransferase [Idiomarina sp. Sol25]|uniref:class I SAM-dependent methyltransferase n=1 Tax=Idiomarina sp. Sol25 TaxID=3064000 RepID=UPI00294B6A47|nr:class I SAM-dependent methyltransferase [Idiomarina sp. Sol25]MDV6328161.1 class I SAM-dependent methyltransferase [Idiomarina sp. Sol25]